MSASAYLRTFSRVNLLDYMPVRWPAREAETAALRLTHVRRVLLGRRVALAHGHTFEPFTFVEHDHYRALILPHPSGRCRVWNDASAIFKARNLVAELVEPWPA